MPSPFSLPSSVFSSELQNPQFYSRLIDQRRTGSKLETAVIAIAMAPSTTDPAITELTKFLRVGVTPAWATRGLAMAAPREATTAADTASVFLSELQPKMGCQDEARV